MNISPNSNYTFKKYSKRKLFIICNEVFYLTNNDTKNNTILQLDSIAEFSNLDTTPVFFTCSATNVDDAYSLYVSYLGELAEKRKANAAILLAQMYEMVDNIDSCTPLEIYQCAVWFHNHEGGWKGADILLSSEVFKKQIFKSFKTFTVTPFDNGLLLIKCDNKHKFGNFRGYLDITEYL